MVTYSTYGNNVYLLGIPLIPLVYVYAMTPVQGALLLFFILCLMSVNTFQLFVEVMYSIMLCSLIRSLAVWFVLGAGGSVGAAPEQVHLALAGNDGVRVVWFTQLESVGAFCRYGSSTDQLDKQSSADSVSYLAGYGFHHKCLLSGLELGTKYFYSCGDSTAMSAVYNFWTPPKEGNQEPLRFAIFGDMGWENSTTRPMGKLGSITMEGNWSASFSRDTLESWMIRDEIDMIWHVGDVGYADDACFHTAQTAVTFTYEDAYNGYMNWIQSLTSHLPYHVVVGNHEAECHDPLCVLKRKELGIPLSNFTAYNARWAMPSKESGGVENMWYSFRYGPVHFVSIDTSTDFSDAPEQESGGSHVFPAGYYAADGAYMQWVESNLKAASEDPSVSWIIAGGHRPLDGGFNSTDLENLFAKYRVAMYFAGHSHSYSRFLAEEHQGVVHVVVGGAGCEEMVFAEDNPTPGYHVGATCSEWSTRLVKGERKNRLEVCEGAAFFTDAYAIGKLTVDNGGWGDLHWELFSSIDGSLLDRVDISAN